MANGTYFHDGEGWKPTHSRPPLRRPVVGRSGGAVYIAADYGVSPDAEDNTAAMQALIDAVGDKGGGVIWMPVGVYQFSAASSRALSINVETLLTPRNGVSIIGESITGTVIEVYGSTTEGAAWMSSLNSSVTEGCTFANFTVDLERETMGSYTHKGKAFYISGIRDCVFRDLSLLNTPSTALGIDMLDNVAIDSVYVYRGGREWHDAKPGGAGIGIGTGKWEHENFVIRNCICDACGHFGIFLEDQGLFKAQPVRNNPKGQIITGNIVRNGRGYGIGIRGGKNVLVTGNNLYENLGGLYLDYGAKNVMISGNLVAESSEAAVKFGVEDARSGFDGFVCESIVVAGNTFVDNAMDVLTLRAPVGSHIADNYSIGSAAPTRIVLGSGDLTAGGKIMPDGSEAAQTDGLTTGYLDVSGIAGDLKITSTGTLSSIRVAQYDDSKGSLVTDAGLTDAAWTSPHVLTVQRLDGCAFIRIFYAPVDAGNPSDVQSIVIEAAD